MFDRLETMMVGVASIIDGIVMLITLGGYPSHLRHNITLHIAKKHAKKRKQNGK